MPARGPAASRGTFARQGQTNASGQDGTISMEKFMNLRKRRGTNNESRKINLTYGDINALFKDLERNPTENKKSVVVQGHQMTSNAID